MRILRTLLTAILAGALLSGAGAAWLFVEAQRGGPLREERTLVLPRGAGLFAIADEREAAGTVANARLFELTAIGSGRGRSLKAGEYAFPAAISLAEALALIECGRTIVHRFTLAEGITTAQRLALLRQAAALDALVPDGIPEGALLPETYHFSRGASRTRLS